MQKYQEVMAEKLQKLTCEMVFAGWGKLHPERATRELQTAPGDWEALGVFVFRDKSRKMRCQFVIWRNPEWFGSAIILEQTENRLYAYSIILQEGDELLELLEAHHFEPFGAHWRDFREWEDRTVFPFLEGLKK